MLEDPENDLIFSVASLWEITIKHRLGRGDFQVEPRVFRRELLENGYQELPITSEHALSVGLLPPIHKDPFDRILLAQATVEAITLLTSDRVVARYPGPVRAV
jgi:PIN domain nuclease of toxin-antitoxin system